MSELQIEEDIIIQPDYEAQKWASWFTIDCQNVQNFCHQIFRGGQSSTDQNFINLLAAAQNSLTEVQSDLAKLQTFLAAYVPPINKSEKIK